MEHSLKELIRIKGTTLSTWDSSCAVSSTFSVHIPGSRPLTSVSSKTPITFNKNMVGTASFKIFFRKLLEIDLWSFSCPIGIWISINWVLKVQKALIQSFVLTQLWVSYHTHNRPHHGITSNGPSFENILESFFKFKFLFCLVL